MANATSKRKERESDDTQNAQNFSGASRTKRVKTSEEAPKLSLRKPRKKCLPTKAKLPKPKSAPLPPGLVRNRKFWFAGADIILKADKTLFRVHRKRIVSMGGMLADMLSSGSILPKSDEWIDGLPVIEFPDFLDDPREVEWLLEFIYDKLTLVTFPEDVDVAYPMVKWGPAIALLHAGHKLAMFEAQNAAIEALSYIFPSGELYPSEHVKPRILGLTPDEKETFDKLHVFQAVKAFDTYGIVALKPMAYYQAAQFSNHEIILGVPRPDGTKEELPRHLVQELMDLKESLKRTRRVEAFRFFSDLTEDGLMHHYPTPDCPNMAGPSGATCYQFLLRLYLSLVRKGFIDSTPNCLHVQFTAQTLRVLNKHLCSSCRDGLRTDMEQASKDVWKHLPRHIGYEGWTELLAEQCKRDKAWLPDSESI